MHFAIIDVIDITDDCLEFSGSASLSYQTGRMLAENLRMDIAL